MLLHELPLVVVELTAFVENLVRDSNLSNVVQQRDVREHAALLVVNAQLVADGHRQVDGFLGMVGGVAVALLQRHEQ